MTSAVEPSTRSAITHAVDVTPAADRIYRCVQCARIGANPTTCIRCSGGLHLIPASERLSRVCTSCSTRQALGARFCTTCGSDPSSADAVVPSIRSEVLAAAFDSAGLRSMKSEFLTPLRLHPDEFVIAVIDPKTSKANLRLGTGNRPPGRKVQTFGARRGCVITDRRVIAFGPGGTAWVNDLKEPAMRKMVQLPVAHMSSGDLYGVELALREVTSFDYQSGSPWSYFTFNKTRLGDDKVDTILVQWKTGPGMLAALAVGAVLYQRDSHGAADRVATGLGVAAVRANFTHLAPATLFEAVEELVMWAAVARAGAPEDLGLPPDS